MSREDIVLKSSDRGILVGASGTGKSTLAQYLLTEFRHDYPDARIMVCDTKPRWRAQWRPDGVSTRRSYNAFGKGDLIPGSVQLSRSQDWPLVWDRNLNPSQSVVVQRLDGSHKANLALQLWCAEKFFASQKYSRPSLIYFDEGMDFFTTFAGAVGGSDIVQRCYRAGREKNLTSLIGVQRPKGINLQCLTETSWCAVFRINFAADIRRLEEMGWPPNLPAPTYAQPYAFRLWRDSRPGAPLYRLSK